MSNVQKSEISTAVRIRRGVTSRKTSGQSEARKIKINHKETNTKNCQMSFVECFMKLKLTNVEDRFYANKCPRSQMNSSSRGRL